MQETVRHRLTVKGICGQTSPLKYTDRKGVLTTKQHEKSGYTNIMCAYRIIQKERENFREDKSKDLQQIGLVNHSLIVTL